MILNNTIKILLSDFSKKSMIQFNCYKSNLISTSFVLQRLVNNYYFFQINLQQFKQRNRTITFRFTIKNNQIDNTISHLGTELLQPTSMFKILDTNGSHKNGHLEMVLSKITLLTYRFSFIFRRFVFVFLDMDYFIYVEFVLTEAVIGRFEIPVVFNFKINDPINERLFTIAREMVRNVTSIVSLVK